MTKETYEEIPNKKSSIGVKRSTILSLRKLEISRKEPSEQIILRLINK